MNKENKKKAQQRRAEERKKEEFRKTRNRVLSIAIPVLLVIIVIIICVAVGRSESNSSATTTESSSTATTLSSDSSLTVEDGDTVNIDYVGSIDGVEFDGGSTQGAGTDLLIGSGMYIDNFEEQLIGSHPGDTVDVNVTFPEDYGQEDLNGQDALFVVTVNGIYQ